MFVRRRPLLRAAVVGGGAYIAGKKVAQHSAEASQGESEQDDRISTLEQQEATKQATPQAPPGGPSVADQLQQMATLHEQGALSDEEFAAAKSRILGA
jgi:Short C-terminal domain